MSKKVDAPLPAMPLFTLRILPVLAILFTALLFPQVAMAGQGSTTTVADGKAPAASNSVSVSALSTRGGSSALSAGNATPSANGALTNGNGESVGSGNRASAGNTAPSNANDAGGNAHGIVESSKADAGKSAYGSASAAQGVATQSSTAQYGKAEQAAREVSVATTQDCAGDFGAPTQAEDEQATGASASPQAKSVPANASSGASQGSVGTAGIAARAAKAAAGTAGTAAGTAKVAAGTAGTAAGATASKPASDTALGQEARALNTQAANTAKAPSASLSMRAHVQNIGWQNWSTANATASEAGTLAVGTSGRALRLEALQFQLKGIGGAINCQVHVQNIGWQAAQSTNGVAGTSGRALRLESVRIALLGELSQWYDIEYRTHVQNDGWKAWVRNGAESGSTGRGLRMEAIEVRLVPKSSKASEGEGIIGVRAAAHVQNVGDTAWVRDGSTNGTTGRALRVEAMRIQLDKGKYSGSVKYRTHVQNIGWTAWSRDGQMSGSQGRALRMEALQISLEGAIAQSYEVIYRAHVQNVGWQDWVSGGAIAGTTGRALRVEAVQIRLVSRPAAPRALRTVDNGLYTITAHSSASAAVGVQSASNASAANVEVVPAAKWRLEEKWQITWRGNGYEIFNVNSAKALDAAGAANNLVANIVQANRNNGTSQRWAITPASGGGYTIAGMNQGALLTVENNKMANGTNVRLWTDGPRAAQTFNLNATEPFYEGTYQLFTKLDQAGKSVDVPNGSLANGAQLVIGTANDGPNQHFTFAKSGSGYSVQVVSSGKYLTASGGKAVQASKSKANTQVWNALLSNAGGIVFVNAANGNVLSVQNNSNANAAALLAVPRTDVAGQRWYPTARSLISDGLYELRTAPVSSLVLDVNGGSFASGANAMVCQRNGGNNQKFLISAEKDGYYRIGMPLSSTVVSVQGNSLSHGANALMETWSGSASQLWKPQVSDGGLLFINCHSGQALSFASAKSTANVCQTANPGSSNLQKWSLVKTELNPNDLLSYRMAIQCAPGGGDVKLNNAMAGYSISQARWNQLVSALNRIWRQGASVGFIMLDENTGMSVSLNADTRYYGASTVKALWVTYLFQEQLEKGRLSWGKVSFLIETAIADSDNNSYLTLRSNYGSEAGFNQWLAQVGLGHIGTWDYYTPRTLALAWTHMMQYSKSNGRYVETWKRVFDHSYYSAIREGIGSYRTTYSKPGWIPGYGGRSNTLDDAAVVDDRNGRRYLLSIMSTMNPYGDRNPLRALAQALDAIHMEMPRSR